MERWTCLRKIQAYRKRKDLVMKIPDNGRRRAEMSGYGFHDLYIGMIINIK